MSVKDEIIRVFKRKVMAYPDGAVVHMGDCGIYNSFLGVCTCGLHHWLWQSGGETIKEIYPELVEEKCNDGFIEYLLQELAGDNLYVKENGEFVKVEKPEPISKEEVEKIINEIFKKKGNDDD